MDHQHESHGSSTSRRRLKWVLAITVVIMLAEAIGGVLSNSLALVGDAGHMLVDCLSLGLTLFAVTIALRPATPSKTFGYHRVEIMATLVNGVSLVLVAGFIFYEAYHRFLNPPVVNAPVMLVIASIGLVANLAGMFLLQGVSHHSLNLKAAFWHVAGDTLSSVGVIIAGIIIWFKPDLNIVDPIIAVLIGFIILIGAVSLVRESVDILMEAVPRSIAVDDVIKMLITVPGVDEVHDVHIWTLTSDIHALSAHLMIKDQSVSSSSEIVERVNHSLGEQFNITHTTLQIECEKCSSCPVGNVCNITRPEEPAARAERI